MAWGVVPAHWASKSTFAPGCLTRARRRRGRRGGRGERRRGGGVYPLPFDACVINWTHLLLALILLLTAHPFKDKAGGEGGGGLICCWTCDAPRYELRPVLVNILKSNYTKIGVESIIFDRSFAFIIFAFCRLAMCRACTNHTISIQSKTPAKKQGRCCPIRLKKT